MKKSNLFSDIAINLARLILGNRVALPHLMAFTNNNSMVRIFNLFRTIYEIKLGRSVIASKPFVMFLEVNNICNLHCPFCLTGKGITADRAKRNLSLDEMKRSIEEISDYLYFIQLYNWGEPLLNKDLFEFIRYVKNKRIFTMVSSNMNFVRPHLPEKIVSSGLDYFIAAIDGFSAQSYSKYRRGGDFEGAIKNLEKVMSLRNKSGKVKPFVEWQYVVFRHNQHEIGDAKEYAKSIGVDYFHPIPGYIEDPKWKTTLADYQVELGNPETVSRCVRPWTHLNVRADGGVAACCYEFYKQDDFGNIFENRFSEIWNNEMFQNARLVLKKGLKKSSKTQPTICHRCIASGVRPSFEKME